MTFILSVQEDFLSATILPRCLTTSNSTQRTTQTSPEQELDMPKNNLVDLLTIKEVQKILGLGRTKVHQLLSDGDIKSLKIGRSRRIRIRDLNKYVESLFENGE